VFSTVDFLESIVTPASIGDVVANLVGQIEKRQQCLVCDTLVQRVISICGHRKNRAYEHLTSFVWYVDGFLAIYIFGIDSRAL
jgi:hypothetical protein